MGFVKIKMDGYDQYTNVDAARITEIEGRPGNWASYKTDYDPHWVRTHEGAEELVRKVEEARG
jgi:hypothetical protein